MKSRRLETKRKEKKSTFSSVNHSRQLCYYLYFQFLSVEPQSVIVITSNKKNLTSKQPLHINFPCDCIISNNNILYEKDNHYQTVFDEKMKMLTVQFDSETHLTVVDSSKENEKLDEIERRKLQHHILLHAIHSNIIPLGMEFLITSQSHSPDKKLSALQLLTIRQVVFGQIFKTSREQFQVHYDLISDVVEKIFDKYLNKADGMTKILVVGDSLDQTESIQKLMSSFRLQGKIFLK